MLTLDLNHLSDLWPQPSGPAGAIESLLCAVVADSMTGDKHDANQELIAQASPMGWYRSLAASPPPAPLPAPPPISITAAKRQWPASSTPFATADHPGCRAAGALYPLAALAAILISVALKMGDWDIRKALHFPKRDTLIVAVTFALTVAFDLTVAVQIGLLLAAVFLSSAWPAAPRCKSCNPSTRICLSATRLPANPADGCAAFRVEGARCFGAADTLDISAGGGSAGCSGDLQMHRWCCWTPPAYWRWTSSTTSCAVAAARWCCRGRRRHRQDVGGSATGRTCWRA